MSAKKSIKCRIKTTHSPGYHLYESVFYEDDADSPVWLQLDGVHVALKTLDGWANGVEVTIVLPRAIARELGLVSLECGYCKGSGEHEPDNNGPIEACPVCGGKEKE
jgi:hypothetical protein